MDQLILLALYSLISALLVIILLGGIYVIRADLETTRKKIDYTVKMITDLKYR